MVYSCFLANARWLICVTFSPHSLVTRLTWTNANSVSSSSKLTEKNGWSISTLLNNDLILNRRAQQYCGSLLNSEPHCALPPPCDTKHTTSTRIRCKWHILMSYCHPTSEP